MAALLALAIAAGCDSKEQETGSNRVKSSSASRPVVRGAATIHGQVTLTGFTPAASTQQVQCSGHAVVVDESVVMGAGGELKNVVVFLKEAPYAGLAGQGPAVLDQKGCRYVPHVVALQTGQDLIVRSSDETLHNVHTRSEANRSLNFGMTGKDQKVVKFSHPEQVRVRCDVHPWMSAWVCVFDHPYFAVTDDQGRFTIANVPAGVYTLTAWHEKFDVLEQQITVQDGGSIEASFTYAPPQPGE